MGIFKLIKYLLQKVNGGHSSRHNTEFPDRFSSLGPLLAESLEQRIAIVDSPRH